MTVVLIGTALLLSVYMVVNILYKRTNHYRNPDRDLENYRQGVPCGIRLANFGTTNSFYAFCAHNTLGVKSFNLPSIVRVLSLMWTYLNIMLYI